MENVEILDISGDLGIRVVSPTVEGIFTTSAIAYYSLTTEIENIEPLNTVKISVNEDSAERLLVTWLNELIFLLDTDGFLGKEITVISFDDKHITAELKGEPFNPEKHDSGFLIKAATYHHLRLDNCAEGWTAEIIFDI